MTVVNINKTQGMNSQWKNPEHISLGELMEFVQVMENNPNPADPSRMEDWCIKHGYQPRQFVQFFSNYRVEYNTMSAEEKREYWQKKLKMEVDKEQREYYKSIGIETLNPGEIGWLVAIGKTLCAKLYWPKASSSVCSVGPSAACSPYPPVVS